MKEIKIALDWTPNTLHAGLYVALKHGFYSEADLDVTLLPRDITTTLTPAKQLQQGIVDLAICPSESIIAYAESDKAGFKLQAIYAILQKDASAIVSLKTNGKISRIADLQNGTYGSYNARYEDSIVRAMVTADGGNAAGMTIEKDKAQLSLFEELKQSNIDATWIFMPWEGVEAASHEDEEKAVQLNVFRTEDYGVPYGYSPVIAVNAASNMTDRVLANFVQATRRGYEIAQTQPDLAIRALQPQCNPPRSEAFLHESLWEISAYYSARDGSELGEMKLERWQAWIDWLKFQGLVVTKDLKAEDLFVNVPSDN